MKKGARRRIVLARISETVALLLASGTLLSAALQLRVIDGWAVWALPLYPAAALALLGAVACWSSPSPGAWRSRLIAWGALAVATPSAIAAMTTIDFSALLACQLLLIAACMPEVAQKRRVVAFVWLLPILVPLTVIAYQLSFIDYRPS
ncbi:MAG: hypothetical protein ACT4OM_04530 [Actinomycetota bacterium]